MTGRRPGGAVALILALASCPDQRQQDVPNRVLDRPTDLALTCVHIECDENDECHAEPASLGECRGEGGSCGQSGNHLVGFVANSERNEVAMFTQCSGSLVDMDAAAPGYNFLPVGGLPTRVVASTDGCRVVSANAGTCDLGVLDAPNLAGFGFDITTPTRLLAGGERVPVEPSSLVAEVVPLRFSAEDDWVPLGARPADVVAVPRTLSSSGGSLAPDDPILDLCGPDQPGSVYVVFPSCDLVAEVDLVTHQILQSVQLQTTADGIQVVDTGVSPVCPADCPDLFDDGVPDGLPPIADDGPAPGTLELVTPPFSADGDCIGDADPCTSEADCRVEDTVLFVGGLGSDHLVELHIDDDGRFESGALSLELVGAAGIERVRTTPVVEGPAVDVGDGGTFHQFVYVIAGDGSTRVVRRELSPDRTEIGIECDTQADPPFAEGSPVCYPVTSTPVGVTPPDRRALANGPGIRPGLGRVTDWTFKRVPEDSLGCLDLEGDTAPFGGPGRAVGVGVTNAGRIVYVALGQFDELAGLGDRDPVGLFDLGLRWHMLYPVYPPFLGTVIDPISLPRVDDESPVRRLPVEADPLAVLAPGLRLIDWAYVYDEEQTEDIPERITLGPAYAVDGGTSIANADRMGSANALEEPGAQGIYQESVVRALARDYRGWGQRIWSLEWEGAIPGARSLTGQLHCDNPGWEGGTCRPEDPDDARLVDVGADFCNAGVVPGDKVVLGGCSDDTDCGAGQACLETPGTLPGNGLCVSAQALADDEQHLRAVCGHFIEDPCGEARREFLITRAFQNELWLQSLDIPVTAYLDTADGQPPDCAPADGDHPGDTEFCVPDFVEREGRFTCTQLQPDGGCETDGECSDLLAGTEEDDGSRFLCLEGRCRRECAEGEDCILRRLPGPECFRELVPYQVNARNAFVVVGSQFPFMSDHVAADDGPSAASTGAPECVDVGDAAGVSTLLTSRIPLGPDEESLGLPACEGGSNPPDSSSPNPCVITVDRASDETSRFHRFAYFGQPVPAIRYSNPIMALVLDLTDLHSLGTAIPEHPREPTAGLLPETALWPVELSGYRRSRIPRGYSIEFATQSGYIPLEETASIGSNSLTFPVRVIDSPDLPWAFVVDASGPGTSTGIRGQVMRVDVSSNPPLADISFDGVR
jgi:hypothetical protein